MAASYPEDDTDGGAPDAARIATIAAAVIGGLLALGALAFFNGKTSISVAIGALIAVANLVTMNAIIGAMLRPAREDAEAEAEAAAARHEAEAAGEAPDPQDPPLPDPDHAAEGKRGGAAWGGFAVLKIVVLFGGVWLLLTRGLVDPIPLVVGYGVLPIGITVSGLFSSLTPFNRSSRASRRRSPRRSQK